MASPRFNRRRTPHSVVLWLGFSHRLPSPHLEPCGCPANNCDCWVTSLYALGPHALCHFGCDRSCHGNHDGHLGIAPAGRLLWSSICTSRWGNYRYCIHSADGRTVPNRCLATPKVDHIRCFHVIFQTYSAKVQQPPNKSLQGTFDPSPALLPQSGCRLKRP